MEYQELIDNITAFLASSRNAEVDGLAEWADSYTELCRQTNDRLRLCSDALRRGLRSDAIQIAEAEPNVLDLVAALDFPELPQWIEVCAFQGLSEAPPLLLESATTLNEAYASEQGLLNMLGHHRLMALARAPLRDRIAMMRCIAEVDSTSSFWDDDIRVFERKRVDEMRVELNQAIRAADNIAVGRLRDEATTTGWRANVPSDLVNLLHDAAGRLAGVKAIAELRQLLPKLNDAYGAMSHQECKTLMAQWLAVVASANLKVPVDLQEAQAPILDWVLEQDHRQEQQAAFGQACDILQQAVDTDQSTPALERAFQATLAFHLELPAELESRYYQRLTARASAIKHRRRLMYVAIVATFIVVAGVVVLLTYKSMLSNEISQAQKTLADAASDARQGEPDKSQSIRKMLIEQHPRILHSPLIIKALNDLDSAVEAERKRRTDFQQHMFAAVKAGVEQPDEADLDAAALLAKLPDETAQIDQLKGQIEQFRAQSQQEQDQQLAADGAKISDEVEHKLTPKLLSSDPDEFGKEIDLLKKRVGELAGRPGVSNDLKQSQLASLSAILNRRQQDLDGARGARTALERVRQFGSTAEQHAAALKQFIAACPDDPKCTGFRIATNHLAAEQAVENWAVVVSHWAHPLPENVQAAKDRAVQVKEYLDRNADAPMAVPIQAYLTYLNNGIETVSEDGPWKGKFHEFLNIPLLKDLRCLVAADGEVFYVSGNITVAKGGIENDILDEKFDAIISPDMTHPTTIVLKKDNLLKFMEPVKSPQALFVKAAADKLERLDFPNWEVFGIDMTQDLMDCKNINPILRAIMLQRVLQLNQSAAAWGGQTGFDKIANKLVEKNVEDVGWLDPRTAPDPDLISELNSITAGLPSLKSCRTALLERSKSLANAVEFTVAGEGILLRNGDNAEIVSSTHVIENQIAWAVGPDKQMVPLGRFNKDHWAIDQAKAQSVPDGSLVFIVASAS